MSNLLHMLHLHSLTHSIVEYSTMLKYAWMLLTLNFRVNDTVTKVARNLSCNYLYLSTSFLSSLDTIFYYIVHVIAWGQGRSSWVDLIKLIFSCKACANKYTRTIIWTGMKGANQIHIQYFAVSWLWFGSTKMLIDRFMELAKW